VVVGHAVRRAELHAADRSPASVTNTSISTAPITTASSVETTCPASAARSGPGWATGESITFDSGQPHLYRNATEIPVEYLVSVTPPSP
jgi:hypothetical protein